MPASERTVLDLGGDWLLEGHPDGRPARALVPGCVHADLLREGRLADPRLGTRERDALWVGGRTWTFSREVDVPAALAAAPVLEWVCEGLDTIAVLAVDGVEVARADNMFRTWRVDLSGRLSPGRHRLAVTFLPAQERCDALAAEHGHLYQWNTYHQHRDRGWVRKMACNFGWDWGPACATAGIWRPTRLEAWGGARLDGLEIRQEHRPGHATVVVRARRVGPLAGRAGGEAVLALAGRELARAALDADGTARLEVADPALWWPNGLGAQPLHDLRVTLRDPSGAVLDTASRRLGLRTLRLVREPDRWGESFRFEANGVPFFAKGSNWIPVDPWPSPDREPRERELLEAAAAVHQNMIRAWGGGYYPSEGFYDACDELGLCVWQDFMFACGTYPTDLPAWRADVEAEARGQVLRLHHRASLALWCGNNELEQGLVGRAGPERPMAWTDYCAVFDHLLGRVVAEVGPDTAYWPGSPHTPCGNRLEFNDARSGDAHLWNVWFAPVPFEDYLSCPHRFNSEFGFQSFPEARSLLGVVGADQLDPSSPALAYRQRSAIGNGMIVRHLLDWFRLPPRPADFLRLSQVVQALAIGVGVEHWRRQMPRSMGTLYWQLNDNWIAPTWSSIDADGRWKALHFAARRFFAPVLVSSTSTGDRSVVELHVSNDRGEPVAGRLAWRWTTASGEGVAAGEADIAAPARASGVVATVAVPGGAPRVEAGISPEAPAAPFLWVELRDAAGARLAEHLHLPVRPRLVSLVDPGLALRLEVDPSDPLRATALVTAKAPAPWTWIEGPDDPALPEIVADDNYFHLPPGGSARVALRLRGPVADPAAAWATARARGLWHAQGGH